MFVVIVGVLILSGAVNTSLIGVNGVLNRVAEDGVLLDWFRKPHRKYGTTFRILNMMALLQIATILASRGDVLLLGEAYAFGVVWSFALKALGVLVLRYQRHDQEYKFPFNVKIGDDRDSHRARDHHAGPVSGRHRESLFEADRDDLRRLLHHRAVHALHDFRTDQRQQAEQHRSDLEKFNLDHQPRGDRADPARAAGCVLVAVRDYHRMQHLEQVLEKTNLRRQDIVVMTVRPISAGAGEYGLRDDQLFADYEQELFSHVVSMAEKHGKRRGIAGSAGGRSVRRHGANRRQSAGLAAGDGRFRAHAVRRTGAADRPGLGESAAAAPPVFARSDRSGPARRPT